MKFQTLALTTVIGLTAVTVGMAQDAATRSLLLRGTNTVTANVGILTVPALTAPRTFTLQNQSGTVTLQTPAVLGTNTFILADATGKLDNAAALTNGQIYIGSTGAAPVAATPTGTRGLVVTTGAGTLDLALPTGASDAVLRYNGTNWVSSGTTFTTDATGNTVAQGDLTIGTTASATGGSIIWNDNTAGGANVGTMSGPVLYTAPQTYTLPDASGTILLSTGGTANQMTRWGAGGLSIIDASLSDNGSGVLARNGNISINTNANTLSTDGNLTVNGTTTLGDADADVTTARGTINLNTTNTAGATVNINTSANGNTTNIGSSTAGNTTSITGNTGGAAVSIANTGAGNGVTITDATATGLIIGTTTQPNTGIRINSTANGIVVNSGAGNDLTINEGSLTRDGNITIDVTNAATRDLVLNNIQVSNPIQDILWITATNQVRRASFAGTANEGIEFSTSAYRLGTTTAGNGAGTNPLAATRYVNLDGQVLSFNRGAATSNMLSLNGGTGIVATDAVRVDVNNDINLGDAITDKVTVKGGVYGSENRTLLAAATNTFAGRVRITFAANGAGPAFTIANTQVTANSTIIVTVQSNTAINYTSVVSAVVAGTSFDVRIAGGLGAGDDLYVNYMIINP